MDISVGDLKSILKSRFSPPTDISETEQWMGLVDTLLVLLRIQASEKLENHADDCTLFLSPLIKLGLFEEAHRCYVSSITEDAKIPSNGVGSELHPWLADPDGSAMKHLLLHLKQMYSANQNIDTMLDDILPIISKAYPLKEFCRDQILQEVRRT